MVACPSRRCYHLRYSACPLRLRAGGDQCGGRAVFEIEKGESGDGEEEGGLEAAKRDDDEAFPGVAGETAGEVSSVMAGVKVEQVHEFGSGAAEADEEWHEGGGNQGKAVAHPPPVPDDEDGEDEDGKGEAEGVCGVGPGLHDEVREAEFPVW